MQTLERLWRLCGTACAFALFGLGGLLIRTLVFPALLLVVRRPAERCRLTRALIHHLFRAYVGLLRALRVFTLEVRGQERLQRRGMLVLANHPSLLDTVFLMALVPDADCVVKAALRNNPFTRGPVLAAGFVCNDHGPAIVQDCIDAIGRGSNMLIFPEGSRTVPGQPLVLQRGAANVAVRGGISVTPVVIACSSTFLPKGSPWYSIPKSRPHITITVKDDIPVTPFSELEPALGARRLTDFLQDYFTRELAHDAGTRTRTEAVDY